MDWFDDFFPDWDDFALAAAMVEAFTEDELEYIKCCIDATELEQDDDPDSV